MKLFLTEKDGELCVDILRQYLCSFMQIIYIPDGLKLCDFGFSRAIEGKNNVCEIQGTPDYVPPEVVQYEPLTLSADIWSVGVLAYVLLTGFSPFGSDDKQETFLNITQCNLTFPEDLFEGVTDDAIDFIKNTLRLKPRWVWSVSKMEMNSIFYIKNTTMSLDIRLILF